MFRINALTGSKVAQFISKHFGAKNIEIGQKLWLHLHFSIFFLAKEAKIIQNITFQNFYDKQVIFGIIVFNKRRQAQKYKTCKNRMFHLDLKEPPKNPRWPPKSHIFAISQYFVGQIYKCDTSLIIFFQGEPSYALKTEI